MNSIEAILKTLNEWCTALIPTFRMRNDVGGRPWYLDATEFQGPFKLEDLKNVTDRESLNSEFKARFFEKDVKSRKGISALKLEISAMYSYNKCFVQRYKGRLHYYRDDLSQKGARIMAAAGQSHGLFKEFKKNLDS